MKSFRLSLIVVLVSLLISSVALAGDSPEGKTFGDKLTEGEIVPISKLYAEPDEYVGKTVKVSGRILNVCAKRGCWMELAGDEEFESMRIKVDDGVIVFPIEAVGGKAVAEGTFTKIELTLEQTKMMEQHKCEEKGEKFDASQVCTPGTLYQIAGTGAVIYEAE